MKETDLAALVPSASAPGARRGRRCPDEARLAAYVAGELGGASRDDLEAHLADCDFCCGQVGFLSRAAALGLPPAVPGQLLAAARGERPWLAFGLRHLTALTATAGIVLAVFLASPSGDPGSLPTADPSRSAGDRPVRNAHAPASSPIVVRPVEGETVALAALEVLWEEVPGAVSYTVQLVDPKGDVAWEGRADGTRLAIPRGARLAPGQRYYVWVLAHLRSGAAVRSDAVGFRVAPG